MSGSRGESRSGYGRRRSNTAQSMLHSPPHLPLEVGSSQFLNTWVHDLKDSGNVILNHGWWRGVSEGDMLRVTSASSGGGTDGFVFVVPREEDCKQALQISIPKPLAEAFKLKNNSDVLLTKVDPAEYVAEFVELVFQDQYLGRSDMWRLGEHLVGQCIYTDQDIVFVGGIAARIQAIYVRNQKVSSACVHPSTKTIYRSLSAKMTIFIQVCRELWTFDGDGERYTEKIVHSFLPDLLARWRDASANHTVTIVLISRVYYDVAELDYAAGPLRQDDQGGWYKDFFKVITDLEVIADWKPTLVSLKDSFWDFQRDILLTHHFHTRGLTAAEQVRLVGRLSSAHDGPLLEALNLNLVPSEEHFIDRSLSLTGAATIVITPGTGHYRVSRDLLRLTTMRMLDQGFGVDLFSLAKHPLHRSPVFSFLGAEAKPESARKTVDPLWDEGPVETGKAARHWWEPFWMYISFWDKQMDLPFREDRFIARARMHEIQMLGLLEHDVVSSIEVPYLPSGSIASAASPIWDGETPPPSENEAVQFDLDVFTLRPATRPPVIADPWPSPLRISEKRPVSWAPPKLVEEKESPRSSPSMTQRDLVEDVTGTSPSHSSIRSSRSTKSIASSQRSTKRTSSKFAPSWFLTAFTRTPSEPVANIVSASAVSSASGSAASTMAPYLLAPPRPAAATTTRAPVPIKNPRPMQHTPPREEPTFSKRRGSTLTVAMPPASSVPSPPTNPSHLKTTVSQSQTSLARRWEHIFPRPTYKHEIKWASIVTPACLPLTVELFPSQTELETNYVQGSYDFVLDATDIQSFMVKPPPASLNEDEARRQWALAVMRGMAAVRLAQGFQFVLRTPDHVSAPTIMSRRKPFRLAEEQSRGPSGAAEVLHSIDEVVWLSMSNEIHRISYADEAIQVKRYVRRMPKMDPFAYKCLIWPKIGIGYTEHATEFKRNEMEAYGWNGMDMLIAGYAREFNESLRYWRTRFVVIPTTESPSHKLGPNGEELNDEETRILGIEKLAEQFTKVRWTSPGERCPPPPVRFLWTTLNPAVSVLDEALMEQLDQIHTAGPLKKKMKSEREIEGMELSAIAKAMKAEDGLSIKHNQWHRVQYPNSFTGYDLVSWLVREFRDVSTRAQGTEWGIKLEEQGLIEHCRGHHAFLDGHYFYRLKGEFSVPMTPKGLGGWFGPRKIIGGIASPPAVPQTTTTRVPSARKKRLILSQTMVIDIDSNKRSDQAETVILHHDIIHNPGTVFHFELQWIGTTARCIEDQLRQWNRTIERYGLRLVEAYVEQISDVRKRNPFQSCFPVPLAVPPPIVPQLDKRLPPGTHTAQYFEYALLRHLNFIIDIEAGNLYPASVSVVYSYRRDPFRYSQFVHRSGTAFVQVLGGAQGFLFLTNRLMGPGRMAGMKSRESRTAPVVEADRIKLELEAFCRDAERLRRFYDDEIAALGPVPIEEPPPLTI